MYSKTSPAAEGSWLAICLFVCAGWQEKEKLKKNPRCHVKVQGKARKASLADTGQVVSCAGERTPANTAGRGSQVLLSTLCSHLSRCFLPPYFLPFFFFPSQRHYHVLLQFARRRTVAHGGSVPVQSSSLHHTGAPARTICPAPGFELLTAGLQKASFPWSSEQLVDSLGAGSIRAHVKKNVLTPL